MFNPDSRRRQFANSLSNSSNRSTTTDLKEYFGPLFNLVFRGTIFIGTIIGVILFGGFLFWTLYDSMKKSSWLQELFFPHEIYALALGVVLLLITILLIYSFPLGDKNTKGKLAGWITIIVLFTFLAYIFFLDGTLESKENLEFVEVQAKESVGGLFQQISCIFNPACIEKKYIEEEGTKAKTVDYQIKVSKQPSISVSGYTREKLLREPIIFSHTFKSVEGIQLIEFNCYYDKIDEKHKFHTVDLSNINIQGNGDLPIVSGGLECENRDKIKLEDTSRQELRIYGILNFSIDVKMSQSIPSVSLEYFIEELGLDSSLNYDYFKLKESLNTYTQHEDKSITYPNLFERVSTDSLTPELPLLIGDGEDRNPRFTITVKEKTSTGGGFADFVAGEITNIDVPHTLDLVDENEVTRKIEFENGIFETSIDIMENDNAQLGQTLTVQSLDFYITAHFVRKDLVRIETKLTPEEIEQIKNANKAQEETQNQFDESNIVSSSEAQSSENSQQTDTQETFTEEEKQAAANAANEANERVPIIN